MSRNRNFLKYSLVSIGSVVSVGALICISCLLYYFFFGHAIQTASSPKNNHVAVLRSHFGLFDYDLSVSVDGVSLYRSSDIQGTSPVQLRAVLIWDRTGRILAYEELGKIKFAYDVDEKRGVDLSELEQYCLSPMSEEYRQKHQAVCGEE